MTDRLPSDHPSVETVRATLARRGRTRSRLTLPADDRFPLTTIRLVFDGNISHARIESSEDGTEINGAYDNARLARERAGEDRLDAWRRRSDIDYGRSVLVDIVESGFLYGVREAGERVVYDAVESPDEGLASIARDLEADER